MLFREKYIPNSIEDFGEKYTYLKNIENIPHTIIYGKNGCGKTTLMQLILKNRYGANKIKLSKDKQIVKEADKTKKYKLTKQLAVNYVKEILDSDPFKNVYEGWEDNSIMLCSDSCGEFKTMEKIYGSSADRR